MLRIGSLFSGYGGLDMAVQEVFGGSLAWVADPAPGPSKLLAYRHPDVPNLGDITAVDWSAVEPVDIITGGSPCQDLSTAGRRAGMTNGTRSNLWVQMREAINVIRPKLVVWENVRGALSASAASDVEHCPGCVGDGSGEPHLRALGRVLGDLADLGFDAEWRGLRASDVGACHQRFRIFVLAWRRDAANPDGAGLQGQRDPQGAAPARRYGHAEPGTGGPDLATLPTPTANLGDNGGPQHPDKRRAGGHSVSIEDAIHGLAMLPTPSVADAAGGHERRGGKRGDELLLKGLAKHGHLDRFGTYAPAIASHERLTGRPAPDPTEPGPSGKPRLSARFAEFMMCLPDGWVTDVPGLSRSEQLALLGNGVVPPQGAAALRHLIEAA